MNNLAKVIALGGRRLNKALAMHYLFSEQGIPKGYIPLAYIKSTGTQYIDLGITPSDDMEFEIEYQVTSGNGKLYGTEMSGIIFDAYNVTPTSGTLRAFKHSSSGGTLTNITTVANEKVALKVVVKDGTYSTYINGELVNTAPAVGTPPDDTMYLFACHRNGAADSKSKAISWGCRVKKSGKQVGYFKPYLNDNFEAGLLNTVDRTFHKNLGTGEFVAGYGIDNYVHDAANLFLDGIWNSGEGVHSDILTGWVDLSGNCQPTPLGTGNTVGTNCITSDGTDNGRMTVPDVDPINLTTFTLELIYQKAGVYSQNKPIIGRNHASSYYVNIVGDNLVVWIGNEPNSVGKNMDETAIHTLQVTCTGTTATAWVDGIKTAENYTVNAQKTSDKLLLFGSVSIPTCFDGSIFAVRLHNRILTDKELAQNYEVDKQRFGLTATASVMMLMDETDTGVTEDGQNDEKELGE